MSDDPAKPAAQKRRKGGRPALPPHLKRTGKISFTPTPDERAAIESRADAAGLSVADFVRLAALGRPLTVHQHRELSPADRYALQRIGVNLNQIAKHMNAGRSPDGQAVAAAVADLLAFIREVGE
ncbi:plasmid mobilization protein [Microvirga sesbaniae]|uniref:plasmid mobilization protein n=1 Tax=Microvirga sesbaniae TaxID=681392 RepID=UPI0021C5DF5B|nr:plasmid mobilization relaxosome protein MobC [Microvirga sp. HBU67692]